MTGRKYSNRRVFPEQEWYEKLRPMLLFGQTAASRAKETGTSERTLHYKADQFEQEGMVSLFPNERTSTAVSPGRTRAGRMAVTVPPRYLVGRRAPCTHPPCLTVSCSLPATRAI
jgi:hypothetical protein